MEEIRSFWLCTVDLPQSTSYGVHDMLYFNEAEWISAYEASSVYILSFYFYIYPTFPDILKHYLK